MRIAPPAYYAPVLPAAGGACDAELKKEIKRVHEENHSIYRAKKVWWAPDREGIRGRRRAERLMRELGLAGAARGKTVRTTVSVLLTS